jgi:hypothetical protein
MLLQEWKSQKNRFKGNETDSYHYCTQVLYVIFPPEDSSPSGSGDKPRNPVVEEYKKKTQSELDFTTQYYKTTGRHWLHYFNTSSGKPRPPPILMWPSETVGFVRPIESEHLYWCTNHSTLSFLWPFCDF